ncbi:MAG: hypothetical protein ACRELB_16200 [Polyangiaceae bacterium]
MAGNPMLALVTNAVLCHLALIPAPNGRLASVTKPAGNVVAYVYDDLDFLFQTTRGAGSSGASTVERHYDSNGNLTAIVDPQHAPAQTTFAYDGFDRLVSVTDALGGYTLLAYDPASKVYSRQTYGHPANQPGASPVLLGEQYELRDELSRVFETNDAIFLAEGFSPQRPVSLLEGSLTPGDGFVTRRVEYDAVSRPTFRIDDDGQTSQVIYDGAGRAAAAIDPLGNRVDTTFDAASNPVRATTTEVSPDGLVPSESFATIYVWDALDRLVRVTDNAGQTATISYDSRDLKTMTTDPLGTPLADPLGLYAGNVNTPGNAVHFVHDGLGRLVRQTIGLNAGDVGGRSRGGSFRRRARRRSFSARKRSMRLSRRARRACSPRRFGDMSASARASNSATARIARAQRRTGWTASINGSSMGLFAMREAL